MEATHGRNGCPRRRLHPEAKDQVHQAGRVDGPAQGGPDRRTWWTWATCVPGPKVETSHEEDSSRGQWATHGTGQVQK